MAFSVFFNTACNVATVYSSASLKLDFVVEWAKNTAANKSPTPVNAMPSPIVGIDMVCLDLISPENNFQKETQRISWQTISHRENVTYHFVDSGNRLTRHCWQNS